MVTTNKMELQIFPVLFQGQNHVDSKKIPAYIFHYHFFFFFFSSDILK